ncbi:hypothetical protein ANCCAN_11773 [Ancylostoma caninum]|uniref:Ionotropic glutamate receptor C-terminal domain-containing protein n=1 Tax=Ancylostoma caninum TaxID=29170 RepID=A0A368GGT9_ANCCA|nr:hypothetical protein ANCCAN_11773 [Ancylostoma caninum]
MHLGISILFKKPQTAEADWFMFLWPLSWEVWLCSFASYMVTSIALWLIAKISPFEKVVHNNETGNWDKVDNQFSFRNAFWFTVCSLMQQVTNHRTLRALTTPISWSPQCSSLPWSAIVSSCKWVACSIKKVTGLACPKVRCCQMPAVNH